MSLVCTAWQDVCGGSGSPTPSGSGSSVRQPQTSVQYFGMDCRDGLNSASRKVLRREEGLDNIEPAISQERNVAPGGTSGAVGA